MFTYWWKPVCRAFQSLSFRIAAFLLKICQLLKHFRDTNYSWVSGGLQRSRVALQPLSPNDILLFISLGKKKQTVSEPKIPNRCFQVPMVHIFPSSQIAVLSAAFEREWKHFSSPGAGRAGVEEWSLWWHVVPELDWAICPSLRVPLLSLWLSDHSFAVISPQSEPMPRQKLFWKQQ